MDSSKHPFFRYKYPQRFVKLFVGLVIFGLSTALNYQTFLGLSPWSVFHSGISIVSGVSIGRVTQLVGACIIILDLILKEPIGFGTIGNMLIVGGSMDFFLNSGLLVTPESYIMRWVMMFVSIGIFGFASWLYMSSEMGAGPRDSLMVGLAKRFPKVPLGILRNATEVGALVIGWMLGGLVGLGTVAFALFIGPSIQFTFKLLKFNVRTVHSESFPETFAIWAGKKLSYKEEQEKQAEQEKAA